MNETVNFCTRCGSHIKYNDEENPSICNICGATERRAANREKKLAEERQFDSLYNWLRGA